MESAKHFSEIASTLLSQLFNATSWSLVLVPIPIPQTHLARSAVFLAALFLVFLAWIARLLRQRRYLSKPMTVEIVGDTDEPSQVEIRPKDAKFFKDVFQSPRTRDERSAILVIRDAGEEKRTPCQILVNQSTKISEGYLRIEVALAREMKLAATNAGAQFETQISIRPLSLWQSTFGNPDTNVSMQWIVGTILGVALMLLQMSLAWAMARG